MRKTRQKLLLLVNDGMIGADFRVRWLKIRVPINTYDNSEDTRIWQGRFITMMMGSYDPEKNKSRHM